MDLQSSWPDNMACYLFIYCNIKSIVPFQKSKLANSLFFKISRFCYLTIPCCWFWCWFHLCSSDYQSVKWKVGHRKASHLADDLMSLSMIGTLWKVFTLTFKWNLVPTTPFFFQVAFQVALTLSCWFLWLMA